MKLSFLGEIDSTQLEAKRRLVTGQVDRQWIAADIQTAGRGRRGRAWTSKSGNLFCTGVYPKLSTPQQTALLSFVAAVAIVETLDLFVPQENPVIKWPNDVLLSGAKTAGILLEAHREHVLIGIGMNLVTHPQDTPYPATHVLAHIDPSALVGPDPALPEPKTVLPLLASRFEVGYESLKTYGFPPTRKNWLSRAQGIGEAVTVRLPNETFAGSVLGLGKNGELQVRLSNGTIREVYAGDVFFEPKE